MGRYVWPKVSLTWSQSVTKCQPDPKPDLPGRYIWPKCSLTQSCFTNVNLTKGLYICMYVCVCGEYSEQAEDDRKGLPDTSQNFDSLIKRIPVIESHENLSTWAKIFNKTCSFEVSIGMLSLILTKGQPRSLKIMTKMSTWSEASSILKVLLTKCKKDIWKFEHHFAIPVLGLASQRSFLWNQRYVYMYVCVCV